MSIAVFEELKGAIRDAKLPKTYLAREAGVTTQTLSRWLDEEVGCPRIDTMMKVAVTLGRHIELTGNVRKMVNYYPKPKPRFQLWRLK